MDWESVHGLAGLLCFKVSHRRVLWLHLDSTWAGLAPKFIHRLQDSVRTESLSSFPSLSSLSSLLGGQLLSATHNMGAYFPRSRDVTEREREREREGGREVRGWEEAVSRREGREGEGTQGRAGKREGTECLSLHLGSDSRHSCCILWVTSQSLTT